VTLSSLLENIFGVPSGQTFTGPELSLPTYSVINLGLAPSFYIITCDVAMPQEYRGILCPVLKNIPSTKSTSMLHVKSEPLHYVPVNRAKFSNIKIEIFDENLDYSKSAIDFHTKVHAYSIYETASNPCNQSNSNTPRKLTCVVVLFKSACAK
jgi:hypothetical protein